LLDVTWPLWNGGKQISNFDHERFQWEHSLVYVRLDLHGNVLSILTTLISYVHSKGNII